MDTSADWVEAAVEIVEHIPGASPSVEKEHVLVIKPTKWTCKAGSSSGKSCLKNLSRHPVPVQL